MEPPLLIYSHIPRTAGTSMRKFLIESLGRERVFWQGEHDNPGGVYHLRQLSPERRVQYLRGKRVAGGHMPWQNKYLHSAIQGRRVLFTSVVREPTERLLSHFSHVKSSIKHPLYTERCFEDALAAKDLFFKVNRNQQNRYISGLSRFEKTLSVLNMHSCLVGCLEEMDEYLSILTSVLGLSSIPEFPRENRARPIPPETQPFSDILAPYIHQDMRLYRWISGLKHRLYQNWI